MADSEGQPEEPGPAATGAGPGRDEESAPDRRRSESGHPGHTDATEEPTAGDERPPAVDQPADEDVWARLVAAYDEAPPSGPSERPWPAAEDLPATGGTRRAESAARDGTGPDEPGEGRGDASAGGGTNSTDRPVGGFLVFAPGVGPRDWKPADPDAADAASGEAEDEGHFVPPEPPPLPHADTTARFAWLGALGGPLLLLLAVIFQIEMVWWIVTLGVGGFLGGLATLVARMRGDDEDEDDDPGRGAVV